MFTSFATHHAKDQTNIRKIKFPVENKSVNAKSTPQHVHQSYMKLNYRLLIISLKLKLNDA